MNERQRAWFLELEKKIMALINHVDEGNHKAGYIVGTRTINGQQVRLWLVAEVVEQEDANDSD